MDTRADILQQKNNDHIRKSENTRLRSMDVSQQQDRERLTKSEYRDFVLKREFAHGATNSHQSRQTIQRLYQSKYETNINERDTIETTMPHRVIKGKKPA